MAFNKEYELTFGKAEFVGYEKSVSPMFKSWPQMTIYNKESDEEVYIDLKKDDIDDLIEGLKLIKETFPK